MIIDFHTHVMPPEMAAAPLWRGKCPLTIENVFEAAKAGGIDKTVISNPAHELRNQDTAQQLATVQMINRYLASLAEKHDNIYALGDCAERLPSMFSPGAASPGTPRPTLIENLNGRV